MNAEDKRAQRLQWQADPIGRARQDSESRAELRQGIALRLEKLRISGSL